MRLPSSLSNPVSLDEAENNRVALKEALQLSPAIVAQKPLRSIGFNPDRRFLTRSAEVNPPPIITIDPDDSTRGAFPILDRPASAIVDFVQNFQEDLRK